MLFHACKLTKIQPNQAWYIGDTEGDMIAAQRAGMPFVFAEYGYLRAESKKCEIKYDERISKPEDLIPLLRTLTQRRPSANQKRQHTAAVIFFTRTQICLKARKTTTHKDNSNNKANESIDSSYFT